MTEQEMIAAHIATHGVTRCPTAIAAVTNGIIPTATDAAAHAARFDPEAKPYRQIRQRGWAYYWAVKREQKRRAAL
jgi:hypothetical protein